MLNKDIFRLAIKLLSLLFLTLSLGNILPNILYTFSYSDILSKLMAIVPIILVIIVFVLMVVKTDGIINIFSLNKGFESKGILNESKNQSIIKLGVFITGGYLFISNIPVFVTESIVWIFFFKNNDGSAYDVYNAFLVTYDFNLYNWIASLVGVVLGYLVMSNFALIARFVDDKIVEKEKDTDILI